MSHEDSGNFDQFDQEYEEYHHVCKPIPINQIQIIIFYFHVWCVAFFFVMYSWMHEYFMRTIGIVNKKIINFAFILNNTTL